MENGRDRTPRGSQQERNSKEEKGTGQGELGGQRRRPALLHRSILFRFPSDTQGDFSLVAPILPEHRLRDRPCSGAGDAAVDKIHRPLPRGGDLTERRGHSRRQCYHPFISQVTKSLLREGE